MSKRIKTEDKSAVFPTGMWRMVQLPQLFVHLLSVMKAARVSLPSDLRRAARGWQNRRHTKIREYFPVYLAPNFGGKGIAKIPLNVENILESILV